MTTKKAVFTILAVLLISGAASGIDKILIEKPMIYPEDEALSKQVDDVIKKAVVLANRRYGDYFEISYLKADGSPDYVISKVVSVSDGSPVCSFEMSKGEESYSAVFVGNFNDDMVASLSYKYVSLWNSFTGVFDEEQHDPPVFIDVLDTNLLDPSINPFYVYAPNTLFPTSIAVKSNGNLIAGFSNTTAELDSEFRLRGQPGADLIAANNYSFAGEIFVTPADTVYFRPLMGREVFRLVDGAPSTQKVRLGLDLSGMFTVLNDGSMIVKDMMEATKATRVDGRKKHEIDFATGPYSRIGLFLPASDGTVWAWDLMEKGFKIYAPAGELIDTLIPIVSADEMLNPSSGVIYPDGSFVIFSMFSGAFQVMRFGRDGILMWRMAEIEALESEAMPFNLKLAFDSNSGYLYLLDNTGKRIFKFLDIIWAEEHGGVSDSAARIIELNDKIRSDLDNPSSYREKAEYYLEIGAAEMAKANWEYLLDIDPYDDTANEMYDTLDVVIMKKRAYAETKQTIDMLESIGPESARTKYMATLQLYEKIISLAPGDDEVRNAKRSLEERFLQETAVPSSKPKPITITAVDMKNLFPSLMLYYRRNPAGTVILKNTLDETISNLRATVNIGKYMDFPSESQAIEELKSGEEISIDLPVFLNEAVLTLQEDLPVQALLEVYYSAGVEEQKMQKSFGVTLYRKTALSWDYSGKIASFIMPNEDTVSAFAHRVLSSIQIETKGLPELLIRGAKIADALGTYGIEYIEDPDSPFSDILGKSEIIDTVRFPRTTLHIRAGDCDDTTALLGSLLESSGIKTAIMTSPGHVFLAFDSGEPAENLWLFQSDEYEAISNGGTVWIPVETTTLSEGFEYSWRAASELIRRNPNEIEFLPLDQQRDTYPPLPLPPSTVTVVEPQAEDIGAMLSASLSVVRDTLYLRGVSNYEALTNSSSGRKELRYRNQLGVLYARFGEERMARTAFEENLSSAPDYVPSYINLANVHIETGRMDDAVGVLEDGLGQKPDSSILNLLLARVYYDLGDKSNATKYFSVVRDESPELAERYSFIGGSSDATRRAGISPSETPLIWDEGEE